MRPSLNELIDWGGNRSDSDVIEPPPTVDEDTNRLIDYSQKPKYHSSHRLAFSFEYSGKPIKKGVASKFGRYCRTTPTYRYKLEYPEYRALVFAYEHSLLIWIKKPRGRLTVDQLIEARRLARECANSIAFKYQVTITREKGAGFSEHIVVNKALDRVIRPLAKEEPELLRERCGITINQRSHKGKLEHHDRDKRPDQPRAKDRVMALERVLEGDIASKEDILELRKLMKEAVITTKETTAMMKELIEQIKVSADNTNRLNDTINTVILGSIKPPEAPKGGAYG